MKQKFSLCFIFFFLSHFLLQGLPNESNFLRVNGKRKKFEDDSDIVVSTKRIQFHNFPQAHNPSIIKIDQGFLLTFRYMPDPLQLWISCICVVILDESFEPLSEPQVLDTCINSAIPSQAEDARIFSFNGEYYVIYNDNVEIVSPSAKERRDLFIAKLHVEDDPISLSTPLKLIHTQKYKSVLWQKNWVPFVWKNTILLGYSINPHEVLYPNLRNGKCHHCYETASSINWRWGPLRGGTPALKVDGQYLAFFHSPTYISTISSNFEKMWHYFMGAYTFSEDPPFNLTKISPIPIVGKNFYSISQNPKRIIYPGGFVVSNSFIYLAYGKDDSEIWIATLDKTRLLDSLVPLETLWEE